MERVLLRVGTTHDEGEFIKRGISELIFFQEGIEGTKRADVAQFHVLDIVGNRTERSGLRNDFGRRDKDELGSFVNEPGDEPGTGDAVDLRTLAGDPSYLAWGSRDVLSLKARSVALPRPQ